MKLNTVDAIAEVWHPETIAWSLSQINRFTGHSAFPYPVSAHSIMVVSLLRDRFASEVDTELQLNRISLVALLHDAGESFLGDMTSSLKDAPEMQWFSNYDEEVQECIYAYHSLLGLYGEIHTELKWADKTALSTEAFYLKGFQDDVWKTLMDEYPPRIDFKIYEYPWRKHAQNWLHLYGFLRGEHPGRLLNFPFVR